MNTLSISGHCAKLLLAAWNSADVSRLRSALDLTEGVHPGRLAYSEQERVEVLHEIAVMIRQWMNRQKTTDDLNASLELLRHLARGAAHSAPVHIKEALPLGMPAYARH
jgi:hypothetical protein